jgi:hypothetical protein
MLKNRDAAAAASAKAADLSVAASDSGGGSASELYTQGTVPWNAGTIAEAPVRNQMG